MDPASGRKSNATTYLIQVETGKPGSTDPGGGPMRM